MEIEECAVRVSGIAEAAVVGVQNDHGLVRMTLYLVADSGEAESVEEQKQLEDSVKQALRSTLSVYKCPRDIRFLERVPRTATGKVQRYLLRQLAEQEKNPIPIQGSSMRSGVRP